MPSEFDLIQTYFSDIGLHREDVLLGIGDDCALLKGTATHDIAMTTDTLIEGVHFFPSADPFLLGHKALAVSLSDLAAMGATPSWFSLAISLPAVASAWLGEFSAGLRQLANQYGMRLVGGDTTKGSLSMTIQAFGWVEKKQALLRSGARVGDIVCVTGSLGDAALAVDLIYQNQCDEQEHLALLHQLNMPQPRVLVGQQLLGLAHAAVDLSDGLLADLGHICQASGVGAQLQWDQIPVSPALLCYALSDVSQYVLAGGDDYELCFTLAEKHRHRLDALSIDVPITQIGRIVEGNQVSVFQNGKPMKQLTQQGFNHFDH